MQTRSYWDVSMYNGNRYSQTLFSGLAGLLPISGNGLLVISCLIAWITGSTCLVHWVSKQLHIRLNLFEDFVIIWSYACLVLWSTQSLDQSVIWRTAMIAYFMPIVAFTWLLMFMIWIAESGGSKWWQYIGLFLTSIITAGFSETGTAVQGGFLGLVMLVIIFLIISKRSIKGFFFPLFISVLGMLIGLALLYFSPVTEIRRSTLPEPIAVHELIALLGLNIKVYLWQAIMRRTLTVVIPFVFGLGLGLIYLLDQRKMNAQERCKITWRHWTLFMVLLPLVSLFLIACVMLPGTYIQVSYPPGRALILAQTVLTLTCIFEGILIILLIDSIFDLTRLNALWIQRVLWGLCLLMLFSVLISSILLIKQNADKLPFFDRWSRLWDIRHEELLDAGQNNVKEIHVIQLDHVINDVGELSPDPDYWYNNCAEMYYGIDEIYADQPGW